MNFPPTDKITSVYVRSVCRVFSLSFLETSEETSGGASTMEHLDQEIYDQPSTSADHENEAVSTILSNVNTILYSDDV